MKKKFKNFYNAWWYLNETPIFMLSDYFCPDHSFFTQSLFIDVQKVNPITKSITQFNLLNTKVEVWLETGVINCYNCKQKGSLIKMYMYTLEIIKNKLKRELEK